MKFTHEDRTFEISEGDEVCILDEFIHEDTRPVNTTTGLVRSVQEDLVGARWFGVGGPWVHYYLPHELSQIGSAENA